MKYDSCEYCGGQVAEKKIQVDHRWKGHLIVVEKVPVGICARCGERYYDGTVLRRLNLMAQGKVASVGHIRVPVADYSRVAAA
jgi:YgiT-type zinc finger domain-containing protein